MNKKGLDISLNFVIIAALALIALIIMVLIFSGGMRKLVGEQENTVDIIVQQRQVAESMCQWYCSIGSEQSWNDPGFPKEIESIWADCKAVTNKEFASCDL